MSSSTVPTRCIDRHPNGQTVYFAGVPIILSAIARSFTPPLTVAHLSYVFAGKRVPSVAYAQQIARALGMDWKAFYEQLEKAAKRRKSRGES